MLTEQSKKIFYDMLYLDVLRGEDSTGVAAISNPFGDKPEVEVFKSVGSPTDFFQEHSKYKRSRDVTNKPVGIMIGHNRFATQGEINKDNAHPFEFDNVVGVHNGTVSQTSLRDFEGYLDYVVDSQIIYSHLSHTKSIDEVWKDADGALALVWWDKAENKLNMIRNNQRPLVVAYSQDDKTVVWASESWMIFVGAARHGLKLKEPFETVPNKLYTFHNNADGTMFHTERDLPPFVKKLTAYHYGNSYGRSLYGDDWWEDYQQEDKKKPRHWNYDEPEELVIREFNDIPMFPFAVANAKDGSTVKINITQAYAVDAKNKIIGRGKNKGYYMAKKLYRSATHGMDYWVDWKDLTYVKLKGSSHIINKEGNGFEIRFSGNSPEYAPWFEPNQFLLQGAWDSRVQEGCLNCKTVPNWGQRNELKWVSKEDFFCAECQEIHFVKDFLQEAKNKGH